MSSYPIQKVLPHTAPMILIDNLDSYDDDSGVCSVTITPNSVFYNEQTQSVPSHVGIEYMAQTIAAYANASHMDEGTLPDIGFLVSSRKYKMHANEFKLNTKLTIIVTKLYSETNGLSAFDCVIKHADNVLIEAKINVYQPEDPEQFLAEQM